MGSSLCSPWRRPSNYRLAWIFQGVVLAHLKVITSPGFGMLRSFKFSQNQKVDPFQNVHINFLGKSNISMKYFEKFNRLSLVFQKLFWKYHIFKFYSKDMSDQCYYPLEKLINQLRKLSFDSDGPGERRWNYLKILKKSTVLVEENKIFKIYWIISIRQGEITLYTTHMNFWPKMKKTLKSMRNWLLSLWKIGMLHNSLLNI